MSPNSVRRNYCALVLLAITLISCSTSLPPVPLVYDYPIITRQPAKSIEETIVVNDQRTDKHLDEFISPSLPITIKSVLSRELIATGCIDDFLSTGPDESRPMPVQIHVQLLETSVEIPGYGAHQAGMAMGAIALGPLGAALAGAGDTEVIGRVSMRVYVQNMQSDANYEGTWTGLKIIKFPKIYEFSSQMRSKALGGALKDAMNHLPDSLARVGIKR